VYVCDNNLREYFAKHIEASKSAKIIDFVEPEKLIPFENAVPVYDLNAAAGSFSEIQNVSQDEVDWVKLPSHYKPSRDLFACKVLGESMNKIIPNGSLCLFRKDG